MKRSKMKREQAIKAFRMARLLEIEELKKYQRNLNYSALDQERGLAYCKVLRDKLKKIYCNPGTVNCVV